MEKFSKNQLERYPVYLKYFKELENQGIEIISSPHVAIKLGYSEEQVRKDLQAISKEPGRPKKGRSVRALVEDLESFLGYREETSAVLIGVGHLGGALLNYPAFGEMGFKIIAGFDVDTKKVGKAIAEKPVYSVEKLAEFLKKKSVEIVIIAVPAKAAQSTCELAIKAGAKAIWNFAPIHLEVPSEIVVENVNLASSLAVLSHRLNNR